MITSWAAEATRFTQDLVRTSSPSGEEAQVAALVEAEMSMLGFGNVAVDGLGNVVGELRGDKPGRTVVIDAHMDTVPVTTPEAWRHPPLGAVHSEGRLWGRGTADDKGPLAAALVAAGALAGRLPEGRVVMAATVGEEYVEGLGLRDVLQRHEADAVVICEPTDLRLGLGHKGRTGIIVETKGRAAHSSRPREGRNAVYTMMDAIAAIRALAPQRDGELGEGVCELVEIVSDPFPGTSMVPPGCRARFDRRLVRGETPESVLEEMRSAVQTIDGVSVRLHRGALTTYTGPSFEVDDFQPAWYLAPESPTVRAAGEALRSAGQAATLWTAPYCTNGAESAGRMGIPTLIYGPGRIEDAHAVDESVSLDDLASAVDGYRALALALSAHVA